MIRLRPLNDSDILKLDRLWQEHWSASSLPGLKNRIVDAIAYDDAEDYRIVGYGQAKLFAELMLFLDPTCSRKQRSTALKLLMSEALRGSEQFGIEEVYCFIKDPDFSLLIQKHYDFKAIIQPGELLLRKI